MAEQFYTVLTSIGKAKIANASALGNKVNLTHFALGDGGGKYYNPTESQTELKSEVWRGQIGQIAVDEKNPNWIVIETIIPANQGGFMIREAGIFDDENNLLAVGKYPETYKPQVQDGSAKDLYIKMILEVANTSVVNLKVDPSIILATKKDIEVLEQKMNKKIENIDVPVTEVVDNLTTDDATKALSAKQGKVLQDTKASKEYVDSQVELISAEGIPKLATYYYVLTAETDKQQTFSIPLETFERNTDTLMIFQNTIFIGAANYIINIDKTFTLNKEIDLGTTIEILILKNVPIGPEGSINGASLAVDSVPLDRVKGLLELIDSIDDLAGEGRTTETVKRNSDDIVVLKNQVSQLEIVPKGLISMWSGAINAIPEGWALCDGTDGTPDLRNRFIVGAGSEYSIGNTGGAKEVALTEEQIPIHKHDEGSLTTNEGGYHRHGIYAYGWTTGSSDINGISDYSGKETWETEYNTKFAGVHDHKITGHTGVVGGGLGHENRPPYYALAFIMKL